MPRKTNIKHLDFTKQNKVIKKSLFSSFDKNVEAKSNNLGIYWEENPVDIREFVTSDNHMGIPKGLSDAQYEPLEFLFGNDPKKIFENGNTTAVEELGKGSGKDLIAAIGLCYITHVLLCSSNPQKLLGIGDISGEPIDFVNVATNAEQASTVFFTKFTERVKRWQWLKDKYNFKVSGRSLNALTSNKSKEINLFNDEVIITSNGILFPKMIRAFSGNSEQEAQEGKNYLVFVLDEAAGFAETRNLSAEKIYKSLKSSARTRFGDKWKGFILSFPRYKDDFIEVMHKKALKHLHWHTAKLATWEVKPPHCFSGKWFDFEGHRIPLEYKEDFDDDPRDAKSKFLCIPPDAINPFIEDHDKIELCINRQRKQMFTCYDFKEEGYVKKKLELAPWVKVLPPHIYTLTIDLGVSQCSCALSLHHKEIKGNIDIIKQDLVTRWEPVPKEGLRVDFFNVGSIITKIIKTIGVRQVRVFFDQWQSELLINIFKKIGINALIYYLGYENYQDLRERIYTGRVDLLDYAPQTKELKELSLIKGNKVDRPEHGTKDICDTIVGAIYVLTKYDDEHRDTRRDKRALLAKQNDGEFIGSNISEIDDDGNYLKNEENEFEEVVTPWKILGN